MENVRRTETVIGQKESQEQLGTSERIEWNGRTDQGVKKETEIF